MSVTTWVPQVLRGKSLEDLMKEIAKFQVTIGGKVAIHQVLWDPKTKGFAALVYPPRNMGGIGSL
jgi:hypothetical protein